jgi:hypothetical protein
MRRTTGAEDEQVGLARGGAEGLEAEARDVDAGGDDRHHLDGAAGEAEGRGEQGVGARPGDGLVHRRREHALLDVLVEVVALDVAAQHVAGAQLTDAEVVGRDALAAAQLLALHRHSRAPRRQT